MDSLHTDQVHIPVLLNEFINNSVPINNDNFSIWDGTLGAAGHFKTWLKKYPNSIGFASDCDENMLSIAQNNIKKENLSNLITYRHTNFVNNPFKENAPFDIIFLDLGISSYHIDTFDRGISYKYEQLLDMRLDQTAGIPIYEWLAIAKEEEIANVIFKYGEERLSRKIAAEIVLRRHKDPVRTTRNLIDVCLFAYGRGNRSKNTHTTRHPYIKTMQAFRVFINNELSNLEKSLIFLPYLLKKNGRLIIISFHSLEDRIVKESFKKHTFESQDTEYQFKIITKKPLVATEEEININQRSRSAKMRILERISL